MRRCFSDLSLAHAGRMLTQSLYRPGKLLPSQSRSRWSEQDHRKGVGPSFWREGQHCRLRAHHDEAHRREGRGRFCNHSRWRKSCSGHSAGAEGSERGRCQCLQGYSFGQTRNRDRGRELDRGCVQPVHELHERSDHHDHRREEYVDEYFVYCLLLGRCADHSCIKAHPDVLWENVNTCSIASGSQSPMVLERSSYSVSSGTQKARISKDDEFTTIIEYTAAGSLDLTTFDRRLQCPGAISVHS